MLRTLALVAVLVTARAAAADVEYDTWGGWTGVTTTATGRFRVEQRDGVWWLVTPAGHGFFSAGVDHLRPDGDFSPALGTSPYHDAVVALYGTDAAWAAATIARLQSWHVN